LIGRQLGRKLAAMAERAERRGPDRWLFDLWSRFYDAPWVQRLTYRPEHDAVLRRLRGRSPRRVLDLGCGTGQLASRIRDTLPDCDVVGVDFSRGMLARAARRAPAVHWVQGNALQLPLRDASCDAAVSTEAFHWFPDPLAALRELHRVLVPNGWMLVALVNPPFEVFSHVAAETSTWIGEPFDWPTSERMRRRVEAAGFRVEAQQRILRWPLPLLLPTVLTVARRSEKPT
jgi:ubiquinone/menaquinone biosynthesis C-methylase UbiE